jgi:hypothetical protein
VLLSPRTSPPPWSRMLLRRPAPPRAPSVLPPRPWRFGYRALLNEPRASSPAAKVATRRQRRGDLSVNGWRLAGTNAPLDGTSPAKLPLATGLHQVRVRRVGILMRVAAHVVDRPVPTSCPHACLDGAGPLSPAANTPTTNPPHTAASDSLGYQRSYDSAAGRLASTCRRDRQCHHCNSVAVAILGMIWLAIVAWSGRPPSATAIRGRLASHSSNLRPITKIKNKVASAKPRVRSDVCACDPAAAPRSSACPRTLNAGFSSCSARDLILSQRLTLTSVGLRRATIS